MNGNGGDLLDDIPFEFNLDAQFMEHLIDNINGVQWQDLVPPGNNFNGAGNQRASTSRGNAASNSIASNSHNFEILARNHISPILEKR